VTGTNPGDVLPVPRALLVRIDSVCSLVGWRGLDAEARDELRAVSREVRQIYEPRR
jgi:hypothetical protein